MRITNGHMAAVVALGAMGLIVSTESTLARVLIAVVGLFVARTLTGKAAPAEAAAPEVAPAPEAPEAPEVPAAPAVDLAAALAAIQAQLTEAPAAPAA
ncbi:hypothetical protein [Kitasatospora cineracea]|uniref:Uncharacterized protein n=1 Tax=Kitasatospora cineracea TaxID=88074 RepID=A0A3N4R6M2_9ACTN|nr:hypothetical protein [Kitasatospora cineracea]RPE26625.1 hypothetical protein EDD38_7687 [Kitasatospora cineracea]